MVELITLCFIRVPSDEPVIEVQDVPSWVQDKILAGTRYNDGGDDVWVFASDPQDVTGGSTS